MKCSKCGHENLIKANYCSFCGSPFTEEEKKAAYRATIYGKLDMISSARGFASLSFITGNIWFKAFLLIGLAVFGFLSHTNRGSAMRILESDSYLIDQNTERGEFYLYTELPEVTLRLYVPGRAEQIDVMLCDCDGNEISCQSYLLSEPITLVRKDQTMYEISAVYENNNQEMRILLYDTALREQYP